MNTRARHALRVTMAMVFVLYISDVSGQLTPPKESKGISWSLPQVLDLTPWSSDMEGRQLRIRKVTVEPGGVIALHSHDNRPDAGYFVQGELVEYRPDGSANPRKVDSTYISGKGVTHWFENRGTVPAIFIAVDIYKPEKLQR